MAETVVPRPVRALQVSWRPGGARAEGAAGASAAREALPVLGRWLESLGSPPSGGVFARWQMQQLSAQRLINVTLPAGYRAQIGRVMR